MSLKLKELADFKIGYLENYSYQIVSCTCRMSGPDAPRSAEQGAATALWLATREFNAGDTTGVLWEDNEIVQW